MTDLVLSQAAALARAVDQKVSAAAALRQQRFAFADRQRFFKLVEQFEYLSTSRGLYGPVLADIAAVLRQIIPDADLQIEAGALSFTGFDGKEYFANGAGLWVFGEKGIKTTARAWWLAALRTRAFFLNTQRDRWLTYNTLEVKP